jgi:hypothetical protein
VPRNGGSHAHPFCFFFWLKMKRDNIDRFRSADQQVAKPRIRAPRYIHGDRFLQGPIPMGWLSAAAVLPGKALHLALAIWMVVRLEDSQTGLRLNARILGELALDRYAKYRALHHLEHAGLIAVSRGAGRKEVIAILPAPRRANQPGEIQ